MGQNKAYTVIYHRLVPADIAPLDHFWQLEIAQAIEEKLCTEPEVFGKPLRQTLKGYRALRVGDYRVVFKIHTPLVRIIAVIHRSTGYQDLEDRI